jgi:hypothetical protein
MGHDDRKLAVSSNQRSWELIDNKQRSPEEADEMIQAAHASLALWLKAGTGANWQRGEWLIARAYTEVGRLEPARHHLERARQLTEEHRAQLKDFDFAFMEALAARIHALAGEHTEARLRYAKAREMGEALGNAEDRRMFFAQMAEPPWFNFAP